MLRSTTGVLTLKSQVIKSNLIYFVDSTNTNSYPGTGTTWTDLSDSGLTTTLVNSPTFSNGILNFSKTSFEYAETVQNHPDLNKWTVEAWFNLKSSLTGHVTAVVCGEFNLSNKLNFSIGTNKAPTNYDLYVGFYDGAWRNTTNGLNPTLNQWYHVAGTYDGSTIKMYVDGEFLSDFSYSGNPQSGGQIRIARRWDESAVISTNFFDGSVPIVRVYSQSLSQTEIKKNYLLDKDKFQ